MYLNKGNTSIDRVAVECDEDSVFVMFYDGHRCSSLTIDTEDIIKHKDELLALVDFINSTIQDADVSKNKS